MKTLTIDLPLPSPKLSPNSRVHWRAKAKAKQTARIDARWVAMLAINGVEGLPLAKAIVQPVFTFKCRRSRDGDNLNASLKAYIDGIADAGVVRNDNDITLMPPLVIIDKSAQQGVVLQVTET